MDELKVVEGWLDKLGVPREPIAPGEGVAKRLYVLEQRIKTLREVIRPAVNRANKYEVYLRPNEVRDAVKAFYETAGVD